MFPHFKKCLLCNIWIYKIYTVKWKSLSHVQLFAIPWTLLLMEFSRPEYWIGLLFPSPGVLPIPGIEPRSPTLQVDSLPAEPQGKSKNTGVGSLSLLHQIFPTQDSNRGLLHCRWIFFTNWTIRDMQLSNIYSLIIKKHPYIHPFNYELEMTLFCLILSTFPTPPLYLFYLQRRPVS